jgi:hypothetical protein
MLTGGQVTSLSPAAGVASPTACDFDPNSSLNLEPSDGLDSAESANMLPPPQPDRSAPATASAAPTRHALPAVTIRIISLSGNIEKHPPTIIKIPARIQKRARVIAAQSRRTQGRVGGGGPICKQG